MSDRTLSGWLRTLVVVGIVTAAAGMSFAVWNGQLVLLRTEVGPFALFAIFFGALVWTLAPTRPRNVVVWIMAAAVVFGGLDTVAWAVTAATFANGQALMTGDFAPADLPRLAAWLLFLVQPPTTAAMIGLFTFPILLAPDGHLPSPRWRWLGALAGITMTLAVVSQALAYVPTSEAPPTNGLDDVMSLLAFIAMVGSLVALGTRLRRSHGDTRQQIKWILFGATVLTLSLIGSGIAAGTDVGALTLALFAFAGLIFVISYGIAVGKYRLYDVDVVISRTLVYGTLAVLITVFYVLAVVGVGNLLGSEGTSPWVAIGVTAVVALAFEPLRERLQRLANRLVYGKRATPYEVLSDFSRRLDATDEELLDQVARSLAEGTTAGAAGVWMRRDGTLERVAVWPRDTDIRWSAESFTARPEAGNQLTRPVLHDGESLGALTLCAARGQTLLVTDEQLLEQIASGMGLVMRNIRLREDLQAKVEKLRRSRRRLVSAQDETRRHLERRLHEGAQQRLVALKLKLTLIRARAAAAGLGRIADVIAEAARETDQTVESLRDFARGVYPPLLESEGPAAALVAQTLKLPIEVTVHAPGIGRYPRPVETAVYFCVLEALQNVVKHARASSAHVALREAGGELVFEVSDDGRGFDPAAARRGSGLANLEDRVHALGGTVAVISSPRKGTTVRGTIPVFETAGLP